MHKVDIRAYTDYVAGYLRYGHYEGVIEMTDEEYEEFKANPEKWAKENDIKEECEFVVDDWRIEYISPIERVEYEDF
jgi:hypothetical protein